MEILSSSKYLWAMIPKAIRQNKATNLIKMGKMNNIFYQNTQK